MKIRPDKTTCIVLFILALLVAGCRATADLGGTSWQLTAYGPTDAPLDAEAPASIQFEDNGRLGASPAVLPSSGITGWMTGESRCATTNWRLPFRNVTRTHPKECKARFFVPC